MRTTITATTSAITKTVRLGTSRYGNPMPRIDVRAPRESHYRALAAELHELAAKAERETPANEHWCIQVERGGDDFNGWVYVELVGDTQTEADRAMELLKRVVG